MCSSDLEDWKDDITIDDNSALNIPIELVSVVEPEPSPPSEIGRASCRARV